MKTKFALLILGLLISTPIYAQGTTLPDTTLGWISFALNILVMVATPWIIKNYNRLKSAIPILQILIDALKRGEPVQGIAKSLGGNSAEVAKAIYDGEELIKKES